MNLLSIPQPFAWAVIYAGMDVVPNAFKSSITGPTLVHATKLVVPESGYTPPRFLSDWQWVIDTWGELHDFPIFGDSSLDPELSQKPMRYRDFVEQSACIIGIVDVTGCVQRSSSAWWRGPWGLEVRDARAIPQHHLSGQTGIWGVSPLLERKLTEHPGGELRAFLESRRSR